MSIMKSRQIYVGGFDKEYYVDEMTVSHLINSIRMVDQNIQSLCAIEDLSQHKNRGIEKAIRCLGKDLKVLARELDSRKDAGGCC